MVVVMCLGMFIVTFLIGYLPSRLKTSQKLMNLIAIFGAGLLVGAAVIVIVPEGMMVLFESLAIDPHSSHAHVEDPAVPIAANGTTQLIAQPRSILRLHAGAAGASIVDPRIVEYIGLSLIIGFTVMLVLDQGFLIVKERQMINAK